MTRRSRRPLILAHRGGDVGRPNSLEAIRSAAERGADGVEIDIQLTDGQLIARHDLGEVEAAHGFDTLEAVLAETAQHGLHLLIDFKSAGASAVAVEASALAEALPSTENPPRLVVSAFSPAFLDRFAQLRPDIERHLIVSLRQNFWPRPNLEAAAGRSVLAAALIVKPLLARRTKRAGQRLLVWFGATEWPLVIRLATRLGADGLIVHRLGVVDRPDQER